MSAFTEEVVVSNTPDVTVSAGVAITNTPTVNIGTIPEVEIKNDSGNPIPVTQGGSSTATTTQITSTGVNQTLLAANSSRKRAILFFNSGIWDVKLGVNASATSRLLRVSASSFLLEIDYYTGQIDTTCTTAGKLVDVTEIA